MLFYVRDIEHRKRARVSFLEDAQRIQRGELANRALETDIYITNTCNLRCSYCYFYFEDYFNEPSHHDSECNMPLEQLKKLVDQISGKTYCLVILGGEPFSRPDLVEFLEYARAKDIFSIRISTNGLLIKRKKHALQYIDTLSVSFDAMRLKQYTRELNQLLNDLSDLRSEFGENMPRIIPSWTTHPDDDFEKDVRPLLDYSRDHGFIVKFLPVKFNQKADWVKQRQMVLQAIEYAGPEAVTNQIGHTQQLSSDYGGKNCLVQRNQHYIDFEGNFLYPCDEYAHQKVGSIFEKGLDELFAEGVAKFGKYPRTDGICGNCPSGCHSDNSYILRFPERQLAWLE